MYDALKEINAEAGMNFDSFNNLRKQNSMDQARRAAHRASFNQQNQPVQTPQPQIVQNNPNTNGYQQYNIPAAMHGTRDITDSLIVHRTAGRGFHPNDTRLTKDGLGAHYTVDRNGIVHQIGDDSQKMWHAGPGYNGRSIGIEATGRYDEATKKWEALTAAQEKASSDLMANIIKKYGIKQENVRPHYTVAAKTQGEGDYLKALSDQYYKR